MKARMSMMGKTSVCVASLLVVLGCGSVMRVRQGGNKIEGIPFYGKEAKCVHQQVEVMPYYRLTLQTLDGEKVTGSQTATVSEAYYLTDPVAVQFVSLINGTADVSSQTAEEQQKTLVRDWETIKKQGTNDVYQKAADGTWPKHVVANSSSPKIYVNYATVYYLNAKVPFAGSAKADYKLASDGTLTEASSEITEETFKTALGALPISDLIKSAAGIGVASKAVGGKTVQLKAERRLVKITNSQTIGFEPGCPDQGGFQSTPAIGTLVEDVGGDTPAQTKPEDNSITVSGKIVLPKSSTTSPAGAGKEQTTTSKDNASAQSK
jgi:hypothetical protein